MDAALRDEKLPFADLNYSEFCSRAQRRPTERTHGFMFPAAVVHADLIVSMPKLKTHHWMGLTASMKNLYGTLPGMIYGWPKNVLHFAGIPKQWSISMPRCRLASPSSTASCAWKGTGRFWALPSRWDCWPSGLISRPSMPHWPALRASNRAKCPIWRWPKGALGPIADRAIVQRGERWQQMASPFAFVDVPHLREMRMAGSG